MEQKTWFLPPDFTFRPDSELALGTVIRHPKRPTLSLASLNADLPPHVTLPPVNISSEANHNHGTGFNQSFGAEILSKFAHLASSAGLNVMYDKERIFDNVDHEIRTYDSALSPETLEAIMELPRVREYMRYGRFGLRSVYIITGHRIAKDSFQITESQGHGFTGSFKLSSPSGPLPLDLGGALSAGSNKNTTHSHETSPGIIFAYRLHVIRKKLSGGAQSELFQHRTAFFTGEGEDEDDSEEMELLEVDSEVLRDDLEELPDFEEAELGDEFYVAFPQN